MRRALVFVLPLLVVLAACHGRSPAQPSGATNSGATITGSFVGLTSTASVASSRPVASQSHRPTTVSVVGTNRSATVDSRNRFSLSGLLPGPVTLHFSGSNLETDLALSPIESAETIDLTLSLDESSVVLESQRRSMGREQQLEGKVDSFPVSPAGSFVVATQIVTTTDATRFYLNDALVGFADLKVGDRVHVKGQLEDLVLAALVVMIQREEDVDDVEEDSEDADDDGQQSSASVEGKLMSMSLPDLVVGTTTVHTDGATVVRRRGDVQDLTTLALGMTLHVVGARQSDSSILARMIQIKGDDTGGAFQITGSMGGVKGTCPALRFSINGRSIATDSGTLFTPACTTFKSGSHATVKGVVQADGSVLATEVTK